jgi:hypothetical protein
VLAWAKFSPGHNWDQDCSTNEMDLNETIRSLYEDKENLERVIESLEALQLSMTAPPKFRPPGRRRCGSNERHQISDPYSRSE